MRTERATPRRVDARVVDGFRPAALQSDDELAAALSLLEASLDSQSIEAIFEGLLEQSGSLEFLLSVISHDGFEFASEWILDRYAVRIEDYSPTSLSSRLLKRFAAALFFLPSPQNDESWPRGVLKLHQSVLEAEPVLDALSNMPENDGLVDIINTEADDAFVVNKKTSQRARKRLRQASRVIKMVDPAPFQKMGIPIPQGSVEAKEAAAKILVDQRETLETLLDIFRVPALAPVLKSVYIPAPAAAADTADSTGDIPVTSDATHMEDIPAAYPNVQPMKAALYFESADGFGEWRILISGRADKNLRETRKKDVNLFRIILKKIKELSKGHFSDDNQKRLTGPGTVVPVFEAKMTRDSRLVYQIDCIPEFDSHVERQVIKVFGIYTHTQMDQRLWDSISRQLSSKGREYQKRCTFRCKPYNKQDNVIPPASFPQVEMPAGEAEEESNQIRDDRGELHDLLVLEKFVTLSRALLTSIVADEDVAHVFEVSPHEQNIIKHTNSCYVLGRSGTGKTTTMLFKMLGLENAWQQHRETHPNRPRQLFVTQSRVLADKVEEYFIKLLQPLAMQSEAAIPELLERQKNREDAGMVDRDEAADWRDDLPHRFSELQDSHFPMFITFDKLSSLLEADGSGKGVQEAPGLLDSPADGRSGRSTEYMRQKRAAFVSYDVFREEYWPHFPQPLTKGLVFSEFLGIIKGSEQTIDAPKPFLDRDTYMALSVRAQSTFASKRSEIYNLFEAYLKIKRERGDYDAADRTHAILRQIRTQGNVAKKIDFLYVDEVQDNLLIDAKLLRSICHNPDGLFWAGDTAQTISVGSSFRFDDLKAFLHRIEESSKSRDVQTRATQEPTTFHLVTNFRSHGGIVKCAHSVIELITKFWPYTIDILPKEKGVVDGIKPVFFSGWDQDNVRYESFLFGAAGNQIEFGAQQCILVRNDVARDKLRQQVGDVGLIMTLYESKGLEFNDVLLYNFFEDSSADVAQWRVILNALKRTERLKVPAPLFDDTRHAGVCNELKFLYVALTRARKNLWLVDRSDTGEPMRMFWTAKGLIQNCTPGTDVPQLAVSSTPEEWAKMARTLFDNKRYFQAMHSYDRAGMPREKAIAAAYHLRVQTRTLHAGDKTSTAERKAAYISVGNAFVSSAKDAVKERTEYYRIAAESFVSAEEYGKAAGAFANAQKYTEAVRYYHKAGMFDEAIETIRRHRSEVDEDVAEHVFDIARFSYLRRGELKKAAQLFDTLEEKLEFATAYDLDAARVEILVEEGMHADAADLLREEGKIVEAIELYLQDGGSQTSTLKAKDCILQELWRSFSFAVVPSEEVKKATRKVFDHVEKLDTSMLSESDRQELQLFAAIQKYDLGRLRSLGQTILLSMQNKPAALLCLDHAFADAKSLFSKPGETSATLQAYHSYARLLQEIIPHSSPWSSQALAKLLHLKITPEGGLMLSQGSFLHQSYAQYRAREPVDGDVEITQRSLLELYRFSLSERLRQRIESEADCCLLIREFDPCQTVAARGRCDQRDCSKQHTLGAAWYNQRLRFHLQQTLIFQIYQSLEYSQPRYTRIWFERLYDSLNPSLVAFGSAACLDVKLIPEAGRAINAVKEWVRSSLYKLDPYDRQSLFLSNLLRLVDLGKTFDQAAIQDYLPRTPVVTQYRPPHLVRQPINAYVVDDLVGFFTKEEQWSLSAGALFFKHILDSRIPVDITVLCRFLDVLCGSFVIAKKLWTHGSLHDLMLPRSWVLELLPSAEKLKKRHTQTVPVIVDPIAPLLERIYSGQQADHILYRGAPIEKASWQIRDLMIARICRTICLLGFNMNIRYLQEQILTILRSLYKPERSFSQLYAPYVHAQRWSYLARTVASSISPTVVLDEMVVLAKQNARPPAPRPGVRVVKFKDMEDIRLQLSHVSTPAPALRAEATAFVPAQRARPSIDMMAPRETAHSDDEDSSSDDSGSEDDLDHDDEKPEDLNAFMQTVDTSSKGVSAAELELQKMAALTFQKAYRRLLRRRNQFVKPGIPTSRVKQFLAFLATASKTEWPSTSYYRFIYSGPLPHLLVCLDWLLQTVMKSKMQVKKQSAATKDKHEDIDALFQRQTELNACIKKITALQKTLEANSDLHKRRDLAELKPYVGRVVELVQEWSPPEELFFDMNIAVKGIVKDRVKPKVEKPMLNVEDLYEEEL
ncbi:hypothetical protein FA95DRAFT_1609833 [Auriscalpium vulgare]|uniref:Uncharacterized protein n=1 Tax=Auriscalpium vulgare TaxID=40419 RepID=A0ACB8RH25_9AGAM|nr:hypothetical protein FA95DRAFT_1609833 [Auriscalpium vulgare]